MHSSRSCLYYAHLSVYASQTQIFKYCPPKPLLLSSSLKEHFAHFFGKKYVLYNPSTTLTSVNESPCMCLKIKKRFTKDIYPYYIQKSGVSI